MWKADVTKVHRFNYQDKETARQRLLDVFEADPIDDPYFQKAWEHGQEIGAEIRKRLGVHKGLEKGYAKAMGAPTAGHIAPESLEGMGHVQHQESTRTNSELEYRITKAGKEALEGVDLDDDLQWRMNEIPSTLEANDYLDPGNLKDFTETGSCRRSCSVVDSQRFAVG